MSPFFGFKPGTRMFSIFLEAADRFIAFFFLGFFLAVIGAFPWSRRLFLTGAFVCFLAFVCFFFFAFVCFADDQLEAISARLDGATLFIDFFSLSVKCASLHSGYDSLNRVSWKFV